MYFPVFTWYPQNMAMAISSSLEALGFVAVLVLHVNIGFGTRCVITPNQRLSSSSLPFTPFCRIPRNVFRAVGILVHNDGHSAGGTAPTT